MVWAEKIAPAMIDNTAIMVDNMESFDFTLFSRSSINHIVQLDCSER